jgi:hypothetical protein
VYIEAKKNLRRWTLKEYYPTYTKERKRKTRRIREESELFSPIHTQQQHTYLYKHYRRQCQENNEIQKINRIIIMV